MVHRGDHFGNAHCRKRLNVGSFLAPVKKVDDPALLPRKMSPFSSKKTSIISRDANSELVNVASQRTGSLVTCVLLPQPLASTYLVAMIDPILLGYGLLLAFAALARGEFMSADYEGYNSGRLGSRPHHSFRSTSETSPVLQVNVWNKTRLPTTGSHIFLRHDGRNATSPASPLILDSRDLTTVYTNRSFENVFGTRVQENFGKKYLTFWAGDKPDAGIGDGFGLAYDENYRLVYNISAQNLRVHSDLHEFSFTGQGTALMTGIDRKLADTSSWEGWQGHKDFPILGAVFQEIDLETNELLFNWNALDHINPLDSSEPWAGVHEWDAFHLNSVQKVHHSVPARDPETETRR